MKGTIDWCLTVPRVAMRRLFVSFRGGNYFSAVALLIGFVLTAELSAGSTPRHSREIADRRWCSEVNQVLESKVAGIRTDDGPGVCSPNSGSVTCCSNRMEQQLLRYSQMQVSKILNDRMKILKQKFVTWTSKFDTFFIRLIERSKRQLHDTFSRDHPVIFQHTGDTFIQLYHDLNSYYKSSDLNFNEALDRFFSSLFQQMFAALFGDQYVIGQEFLDCLVEHMEPIRPFGSVPARLALQASSTAVVARTFVKGLAEGTTTIITAIKQPLDDRCLNGMARTLHCSLCRGLSSAKPCSDHCVQTASNCPRLQMELKDDWIAYLDTLVRCAKSFSSNFSIEGVVGRIDYIVSEAVESFLQNKYTIQQSAFSICGTPSSVARKRRETELDEETTAASQSFHYSNSSSLSSSSSSSSSSFLSPSTLSSTVNETTTAGQTVIRDQRRLEGGEEEEEEEEEGQRGTERPRNEGRHRHRQKPRRERQRQQQTERVTRPIRQRTNKTQEQNEKREEKEEKEKEEEEQENEEEEEEEDRRAGGGGGGREELRHRAEDESERRQKKRPSKKQQQQQRRRQTPSPPTQSTLSQLQTLAADFLRKFDSVRELWTTLPQTMCDALNAERNNRTTCWNGVQMTSGETDAETHRGAEETTHGATSSIAEKESLRLRNIVASLQDALRGLGDLPDIDDWASGMEFGSGADLDRSPFVTRTSPPLYLGPSRRTSDSTKDRPPKPSSSHSAPATFCGVIVVSVAAILVLNFVFH